MARDFFTKEDRERIEQAIKDAEERTRGEIQVHLENHCKRPVLDRAAEIFRLLQMHKTEQRSGVLFYLAIKDHQFAVLGDEGINKKVPLGFWDDIIAHMEACFKEGKFTDGLCEGIQMAGNQLGKHFPPQNNFNELSNDISFGDD